MKRICIFCGSKPGKSPEYTAGAQKIGVFLARKKINVVYGGGQSGLMGAVADGALSAGGEVVGIMPRALDGKEIAHSGLTELHYVNSMHERKELMAELSDGFIALPGGMGTLEEFCETVTWGQLGIHRKPFGLLNIAGYYDLFISFLDHAVEEGFFLEEHRKAIIVETDQERLLERMQEARLPEVNRPLGPDET